MRDVAAEFEKAIRYAAIGPADVAELDAAIAQIPHGPLADYLEERGWYHDENTLATLRAAAFGELPADEFVHVVRHPTSGKAVAWRDGGERLLDSVDMLHRLQVKTRALSFGVDHVVHGPGGVFIAEPPDRHLETIPGWRDPHLLKRLDPATGRFKGPTIGSGPLPVVIVEAAKRAFPS